MTLSKDDAAKALNEIGVAEVRIRRLRYYRDSAPIFMMWGVIWLVANVVIALKPGWAPWAWMPAFPGVIVSGVFGHRHSKLNISRLSPEELAAQPNFGIIGMGGFLALTAILAVVWPVDYRQMNAVYSLVFAGAYVVAGAWVGWRLVFIGAALGIGTFGGYFLLTQQAYFLWMGGLGAAALIGGGLWMRKA